MSNREPQVFQLGSDMIRFCLQKILLVAPWKWGRDDKAWDKRLSQIIRKKL